MKYALLCNVSSFEVFVIIKCTIFKLKKNIGFVLNKIIEHRIYFQIVHFYIVHKLFYFVIKLRRLIRCHWINILRYWCDRRTDYQIVLYTYIYVWNVRTQKGRFIYFLIQTKLLVCSAKSFRFTKIISNSGWFSSFSVKLFFNYFGKNLLLFNLGLNLGNLLVFSKEFRFLWDNFEMSFPVDGSCCFLGHLHLHVICVSSDYTRFYCTVVNTNDLILEKKQIIIDKK